MLTKIKVAQFFFKIFENYKSNRLHVDRWDGSLYPFKNLLTCITLLTYITNHSHIVYILQCFTNKALYILGHSYLQIKPPTFVHTKHETTTPVKCVCSDKLFTLRLKEITRPKLQKFSEICLSNEKLSLQKDHDQGKQRYWNIVQLYTLFTKYINWFIILHGTFCDFFFRIIFSVATSSTSELDATIHWVPPAIICE